MGLLSKLLNQSAEGLISNAIIKKQSVTLSEFFDTHYYPHAESTRKKPKVVLQTFDKHMREFLGKYRFPEIDNALLDSWVRDQVKKKYQTSTINKHIFLVNRLLNLARRWNYIDQNTFENLQIKRVPLGDFKQRFLGVDEIAAVLKSAERGQHPFMYFILKEGLKNLPFST